jgi:hypothetical protein
MRVLVCGGRNYSDFNYVQKILNQYHLGSNIKLLIAGGATGADTLAETWAYINRIPTLIIKAEWQKFGRAAGNLRNTRMLVEGQPTIVIAFPGSAGTANMVKQAQGAHIAVKDYRK